MDIKTSSTTHLTDEQRIDWLRLIRNYDQMGISPITIPYFAAGLRCFVATSRLAEALAEAATTFDVAVLAS